ncbi:50S ribosomal protein L34e [Aeropyrum camini]|uniref:Large ribosomal subunit protein eL34 n=1 Tax=Aeropyrum camini SY1 = JCM 12091 TaxID=1198449 RepID=U3TFN4_9CREN|nr:50S ribosomal protein L34e [Aeropyrum camini]BAN90114.1 50S ribosomal protein L34 [Aeropyrum camini SY1 = JCM 12091]
MVRPALRSRSLRRVYRRTPGGYTVVHYERRKPGPARCARCGRPLGGVPRGRPPRVRRLSKTAKRPERPYGGVLCSTCLAELIFEAIAGSS